MSPGGSGRSTNCQAQPEGAEARRGQAAVRWSAQILQQVEAVGRRLLSQSEVELAEQFEIRPDRPWSAVPVRARRRQDRRRRAPDRQAHRAAGEQKPRWQRACAAISPRVAGTKIRRTFAARRPRPLRLGRRALRAETSRPRQRRNDPPLPAPPRPLSRQPHKATGL